MRIDGLIKLAKKTADFCKDIKKGALHKKLGIPQKQKIPPFLLQSLKNKESGTKVNVKGKKVSVTPKMKKKVNFAINAKKWKKK